MTRLPSEEKARQDIFSLFITDFKKFRPLTVLIPLVVLLVVSSAILTYLEIWIASATCLLISLPLLVISLLKYYELKKRMDEKSASLDKALNQKEKYLSDFSHRIRTPLNNFAFIVEYLNEREENPELKEMIQTLMASTSNMVEVVNDLSVQTSRVSSFTPANNIKFNLLSALQSTIDIVKANNENSVSFSTENISSSDNWYTGDPVSVKQIFLDIFNSVLSEHNNDDTKIIIRTKHEGLDNDTSRVSFELEINRIIESFNTEKQGHNNFPGMAIRRINRLEGKYETSICHNKTIFGFSLDLRHAAEEESQSKAAERIRELNTGSKESKQLSDADILLVEDNPTNQKIVQLILQSKVKSIDTAETGKEALDKFGTSNYDIILMDIQLPVIDGITVAGKIREIEKSTSQHTPIIAITANAMIGDKEKCLSVGMDEYLSKPFQPAELIEMITRQISRVN